MQCDLFKGKRLPSGYTKEDIVGIFKQDLFDIWCVEPTKKSNAKYKRFPMPDDYIPFSCWQLWVDIGPPAGDACNLILKVEFIAPPSASFIAKNGASTEEPPAALLALNAGVQSGRFISRRAMSQLPASTKPECSPTSSIQGERLSRDKMNDKISQLKWLAVSEFCSDAQKAGYRRQIHDIMTANCDSSSSPMSTSTLSAEFPSIPTSVSKPGAVQEEVAISCARKSVLNSTQLATRQLNEQVASAVVFSPLKSFLLGEEVTEEQENSEPQNCYRLMSFVDYKKWLKFTHNLHSNCVPADGACLFESTIRCIKELVSCSEGDSYRPSTILAALCPDWTTVSASSFRKAILTIMQSIQMCHFPALDPFFYDNLNQLMLAEGCEGGRTGGIVDHKFRNDGKPPQQYSTADEYFKLMASESAYGNLSMLLAICICCEIQIHVWICGKDLPEVYGAATSTHYISFIKQNRLDHYDGLTWFDKKHRDYDASKRAKIIDDEIHSRDVADSRDEALERAAARGHPRISHQPQTTTPAPASEILSPAATEVEATASFATSPPPISLDKNGSVSLVSFSEAAAWEQVVAQATVDVVPEAAAATHRLAADTAHAAKPRPAAVAASAAVTIRGASSASAIATPTVPLTSLEAEDASSLKGAAPKAAAIVISAAPTATPKNPAHRSLSPMPVDTTKDIDKEMSLRDKLYKKWYKAKASFDTIKWDRDIMRRESGTVAGKGIFAKLHIPRATCVALYWGNLVDGTTGLIQVLAFFHAHALALTHSHAHCCFTISSFSSSPCSAHARQRGNSLRPTPTLSENIPEVTESSSAEMASICPLTEVIIVVPLMILMRTGETYCVIVIVLNLLHLVSFQKRRPMGSMFEQLASNWYSCKLRADLFGEPTFRAYKAVIS